MEAIDLEWIPLRGASAYRLTLTDADTSDRLLRTDPLDAPRYALDPTLADGREVEARLEFLPEGKDDWEPAGPTARIPVPDPAADTTLLSWEGRSPIHRLVVADQTAARTVFDRPVLGSAYPYVPSPSERGHDLVMRVHNWRDGDWDEGTEWRPLPLRILLGERRDPPPPLGSDGTPPLLLAFTIDTEGFLARQLDPNPARTVDELIFGDFGNFEHYGIGLHMDLLEHFGFRGTFFVDVLAAYQYGEDELRRAVEAIMDRGHDVQLHVHDEHLRNSDDLAVRSQAGDLSNKDGDAFRRILDLGVTMFERLSGTQPVAYRAGGYRINDEHFPVLEEFGIRIDSSVHAYIHSRVSEWMKTHTQPFWIGDVLELPVTWTLVRDDRAAPETRAFAPNRTAGDPVSRMPASPTGLPRVMSYVSHSCELMQVKGDPGPEAVAAYERSLRSRVRPEIADRVMHEVLVNPRLITGTLDHNLVYRVAGLLRRIADRDGARCVTLSELQDLAASFPRDARREPVDPVPAIDRPHGAATVTGTRIYSRELLERMSSSAAEGSGPAPQLSADAISTLVNAELSWEGKDVAVIGGDSAAISAWLDRRGVASTQRFDRPNPEGGDRFDVVVWLEGFEECPPERLRARLEAATVMLRDDGTLVLRVHTLGVARGRGRNGLPPLAELLFPSRTVGSTQVVAWDAPTFSSWLEAEGMRIAREKRVPRAGVELAALERFPDKFASISDRELRTAAVDFTLRRRTTEDVAPADGTSPVSPDPAGLSDAVAPGDQVLEITAPGEPASRIEIEDAAVTTADPESLATGRVEEGGSDVVVCFGVLERIEPERIQAACDGLYGALRPGGHLLLGIGEGLATPTTVLVGLLRAGFEAAPGESEPAGGVFRLLRPLELADIAAFAGKRP